MISLNLSNNDLGDLSTIKLCRSLTKQMSLKTLILDHNKISDISCESINALETSVYTLKTISLYWNLIRGPGAAQIFSGILENFNIKILNLGWNNIGHFKSTDCINILCKMLKEENLIHLDISHNGLNKEQCSIISQALLNNHSLIGIHVEGNNCSIDPRGFMKVTDACSIPHSETHLRKPSFLDMRTFKVSNQSRCWICEGWTEKCFTYEAPEENFGPVYIHINFLGFDPLLMQSSAEKADKKFIYWCTCPPGEILYYFSKNKNIYVNSENIKDCNFEVKCSKGILSKTVIKKINTMTISAGQTLIDNALQVNIKHSFPRLEDGKFMLDIKKIKPPWSIPISIFKDFKVENATYLDKCFEFDWVSMKLPKLVDEEAAVKAELRKSYKLIKENYKILSVLGRVSSVFGIEWLIYNEFVCNKINLVDGVEIKLTASDLLFKAINGRPSVAGASNSTTLSLVRHEFMEVLLKLSIQRYYDTGAVPTRVEAVKKLYDTHLCKYAGNLDSQRWREERYWNEECDNILQANWDFLFHIYTIRGGSKKKPGEKPYFVN